MARSACQREQAERHELGHDRRRRLVRARPCHVDRRSNRDAVQKIFSGVKRGLLLAAIGDDEYRLPDADVFANLCNDNSDDAVGRRSQQSFFEMPLEHRKGCCRGLDARVGDGALFSSRATAYWAGRLSQI
jgi:hypothetical protein